MKEPWWWMMGNAEFQAWHDFCTTFYKICYVCLGGWVSRCEYVLVIAGTHRGFGFPGAGVTDGCEPPNMGSENQTRVFWKSSRLSWLLGQLPRPTAAVTACVKSARDWACQHFVIEGVRGPWGLNCSWWFILSGWWGKGERFLRWCSPWKVRMLL